MPAAIVLEVLRPFCFLCSQALLVVEPLVGRIPSPYGEIFTRPGQLDHLLELLERQGPPTDDAEGG